MLSENEFEYLGDAVHVYMCSQIILFCGSGDNCRWAEQESIIDLWSSYFKDTT